MSDRYWLLDGTLADDDEPLCFVPVDEHGEVERIVIGMTSPSPPESSRAPSQR